MFSDFVATKILHELYQLCCEKRFRPHEVKEVKIEPRTTLYKYLIIPKERQPPPLSESEDIQPTITNTVVRRSVPRSSSNDNGLSSKKQDSSSTETKSRSRSATLPFLNDIEVQERSQSYLNDDEV